MQELQDPEVITAKHLEYQVDSVAHGLSDLWRVNIQLKGLRKDYRPDFRGFVFFSNDGQKLDMRNDHLFRADLNNVYLHQVDLSQADLRDSILVGADLSEAKLAGAHLDGADVKGANFESASGLASTWTGVKWWQAAKMSDALCSYMLSGKSKAEQLPPGTDSPCRAAAKSLDTSPMRLPKEQF